MLQEHAAVVLGELFYRNCSFGDNSISFLGGSKQDQRLCLSTGVKHCSPAHRIRLGSIQHQPGLAPAPIPTGTAPLAHWGHPNWGQGVVAVGQTDGQQGCAMG